MIIYGAGDAGMIAAVNLARAGYEVIVRDQEESIGGSPHINPSAHTTPIDVAKVSEYIGIDLSPVFFPTPVNVYIRETKAAVWKNHFYTVERGPREGSLDTLLYNECLKEGVRFEFDTPLRDRDINNLPQGTIVACGLNPAVYKMLDVPFQRWYGYISRGEIGIKEFCLVWVDECVTEYGYIPAVNNFYFNLLFSTRPVEKPALQKYESFLRRHEGIEHKEWVESGGAVPVASPDNPRLYHNGLILAGTLGGWMDPFAWFGILGSIMSGKVAALALIDPERAVRDFKHFNSRFKAMFYAKKMYYKLQPYHAPLLEMLPKAMGTERSMRMHDRAVERGMQASVPGYAGFMAFNK